MSATAHEISGKLQQRIGAIQNAIAVGTRNNAERERYVKALMDVSAICENLEKCRNILTVISRDLEISITQYREQQLDRLTAETKKVLDVVFPDEDFQVAIDWDVQRGNPVATVLLGKKLQDGTIDWFPPTMCNGEFVKQLVAFIMIAKMNSMLGARLFCTDECLNSGDNESLENVSVALNRLKDYLQLISIEHKKAYYTGITHKEINLVKHRAPDTNNPDAGWVEIISQNLVEAQAGYDVESVDVDTSTIDTEPKFQESDVTAEN